ncbi:MULTISPECIES: ATP-binding protein [unclassified Streptomyces]|uniref:ATP-binding protein n=1 Tax=unclassified Streptomyces TaxID=2593676 RepID=UPI001660624D|nr:MULTISPECIES: ATP-binding protein [unclassified Streptomyces]MBD0710458.1 hypothetical protein [Streptomyces sp. CBMA291]MBD0712793.1 hypothetical protein [Streptomyces sp. CBMA370]
MPTTSEPARRSLRLGPPDEPAVAARCRDFCRAALADLGWPEGPSRAERDRAVEDVLLVVSEAVTNACRHAGGPTELVVRCVRAGGVRVEVTDHSSRVPRACPPGAPGSPGGHGLAVITRLTRAWGTLPRAGGKCVWMEIGEP